MHAQDIAALLLEINALQINTQTPFQFSSGIQSPIYCDNRLLISYPEQRQQICRAFFDIITKHTLNCDIIAGTATAAIPHAAWLAQICNKPMIYVRSSSKGHGKKNQIEGRLENNQTVLMIEDLIATGGSALNAIAAVRGQGAILNHCLCIFDYGFSQATLNFDKAGISVHSLTSFDDLMTTALDKKLIDANAEQQLRQWQADPEHWRATH